MTLSQLETLVWSWLDDPQGGYFTQAQVDVWLNNATKEVQKQLIQAGENYYVERMSGLFLAGQDTYALPSDCKKIHKIEIVLSGTGVSEQRRTLDFVTFQQLDMVAQNTGSPCVYNIKRNLIIIRPIPDINYSCYLHQSYRVADLVNSTDVPDVPSDYHEYIAVLATLDGFMKDQRDASQFVIDKQQTYLKRLNEDAENRDLSAPRTVVVTEADNYGFLF